MFITITFITVKNWQEIQCFPIDEQLVNLAPLYQKEYNKKKKNTTTQLEWLQRIMPNKKNQS